MKRLQTHSIRSRLPDARRRRVAHASDGMPSEAACRGPGNVVVADPAHAEDAAVQQDYGHRGGGKGGVRRYASDAGGCKRTSRPCASDHRRFRSIALHRAAMMCAEAPATPRQPNVVPSLSSLSRSRRARNGPGGSPPIRVCLKDTCLLAARMQQVYEYYATGPNRRFPS